MTPTVEHEMAAIIGWYLSGATMVEMVELSGYPEIVIKRVIDEYETKKSKNNKRQRPDPSRPSDL